MAKKIIQGRYELGNLIGAGNFAKVFVACDIRRKTDNEVAIKVIDKSLLFQTKLMEHIKREIDIMQRVRHRHIVQLFEVMASKQKVYMVMEYVRGGELIQHIKKGLLPEQVARRYFRQLISAVAFCHARGVFHRDLKPENILVDENGDLKVVDFGLSALVEEKRSSDQSNMLKSFVGTPAYIAPEVLKRQGYDGAKIDIWSCGIVLFVLMAGYVPFNANNLAELYQKIDKGDFWCPPWFEYELEELLHGILNTDPNKRMTIKEIMESSWFTKDYETDDHNGSDDELGYDSDSSITLSSAMLSGKQKPMIPRAPSLNAFHIISFSQGFDLSGLFEETVDEMRYLSREPVLKIVSALQSIAKVVSYKVRMKDTLLMVQGTKEGLKGPLTISVELSQLDADIVVVHVKKKSGEKDEYDEFLNKALKPRLRHLVMSPLIRTPQRKQRTPSPAVSWQNRTPSPMRRSPARGRRNHRSPAKLE